MANTYDTLNTVLYAARVRLGKTIDTLDAITGKLGNSTYAFSQQAVNNAWRKLQARLASMGYVRLENESVIYSVPVAGSLDPAIRLTLTWNGGNDGVNVFTNPQLPQDLIFPQIVRERPSGTGGQFREMDEMRRSIPLIPKQSFQIYWQWQNDTLIMPGAQTGTDIFLHYAAFLPDFTDFTAINAMNQTVPILRSLDALADLICAEVCSAQAMEKNDTSLMDTAMGFEQKAQEAARFLVRGMDDPAIVEPAAKANE